MRVTLGDTIDATIPPPAGNPDDLTARVEVPGSRVVVVAEQTIERVPLEFADEDGVRVTGAVVAVALDSPTEPGEYLICWSAASTGYEAFEPLLVS
jgi:hypothetical protein